MADFSLQPGILSALLSGMLSVAFLSAHACLADPAPKPDGGVRGFVVDAQTGEALQGANVVLRRGTVVIGQATDGDGYFLVGGLDAGTYVMEASYIGYLTSTDTVRVEDDALLSVRIALDSDPAMLDEIVVESSAESSGRIDAGVQRVQPADINQIPVPDVTGDLVAYLQVLPGVLTSGDRGGQLFIRGGTPTQNLILLDGMPIYQPFHMIGFFSSFPSEIIHHADIHTGGFDAPYGGRLSSVIDVSARNGNKGGFHATGSLAPFLSTLTLEGPLSRDKTSILVSIRESLLERLFPGTISSLPFVFGDQFVKVHSIMKDSGQLSIAAMRTHDSGVVDDTEREGGTLPSVRQSNPDDRIRWTNGAIGLRYLLLPPDRPFLAELTLSYSQVSNTFGAGDNPDRSSRIGNFRSSATIKRPLGSNEIRWGLAMQKLDIEYSLDGVFQDLDDNKEPRVDAGFFVDLTRPLGRNVSVTAGIHSHLYAGAGWTLEPRVRARWEPGDGGNTSVNAAWGMYSQNLAGLQDERDAGDIFTAWVSSPLNDKIPRAMHAIAGVGHSFSPKLRLDVEGYYRTMRRLAIPAWTPLAQFTTTLQSADGRAVGIDMTIEWDAFPFRLYSSYGLGHVRYTATQGSFGLWYGSEQASYNPRHDRRHQLSVVGSYSRRRSAINIQWQLGSGIPFTRPIGFDDWVYLGTLVDVTREAGEYRVLFERPYQGRLPAYHRLDVSIERKFITPGAVITVKGGVMNAYNRQNLFYFDVWTLRRVDQMSLLPWIALRLDV